MTEAPPRAAPTRFSLVDIARGTALVAMAVYHFTWDLEFFGYLSAGTTAQGAWKVYARSIASSFLFLVGISLVLAHTRGIRWRSFGVRLAMVGGAALAITAITWWTVPDAFIFFGILHHIALASVLGLAFLRMPALVTAALGVAAVTLPFVLRSEAFSHPLLVWIGLAPVPPRSNDFVPLFPWFGAVLLGMAFAKLAAARAWLASAVSQTPPPLRPLTFIGRHSLAFYLLHQPLLIAIVWLAAQVVPPTLKTPEVRFIQSCQRSCEDVRDGEFCTRYCACMIDRIEEQGLMGDVFRTPTEAAQSRIGELAAQCTAASDASGDFPLP